MRYLIVILALAASLGGCRHADDPDIYRPETTPIYVPTDYE